MPIANTATRSTMILAVLAMASLLTGCVTGGGGEYRESRHEYRPEPPRYGQPAHEQPGYGQVHGPLTIRVTGASYGAGRQCDATQALRRACDGHRSCAVGVSNNLCGDPVPGTRKGISVEYFCEGHDGGGRRASAPENRDVYLSCD